MIRIGALMLFSVAVFVTAEQSASAQGRRGDICRPAYSEANPDLFYNYYVGPACGATPAAMYTAPVSTPQVVGNTWYTYQALYPDQYMYRHHRTYLNYYDNCAGMNRTHVHYNRTFRSLFWNSPW